MEFNQLPEDYDVEEFGPQKRQAEFASPEAKLNFDAQSLIAKAETQSVKFCTLVDPIFFAQRADDDIEGLRAIIVEEQQRADDEIKGLLAAVAKEQGAASGTESTSPAATPTPGLESTANAPRQLTPDQKESTLATLAARFKANEYLHKGVEWTKVKASLEAKPEALWSINEMEKAGHEPDVYNADDRGFDIGTCSKESPESGRNCVYDEEAAQLVLKHNPGAKFNGSAVAMAEDMGINLMDQNLYKNVLRKKGRFNEQTWSWLLTKLNIRSTGGALSGTRYYAGGLGLVRRDGAGSHSASGSWRGSLRVEWAA